MHSANILIYSELKKLEFFLLVMYFYLNCLKI